jgi:uncharacterized protein (DUF1015 family)
MVHVRPFAALRPPVALASAIASPPYDIISSDEARALAAGNPDSFLHVTRPEIDLDATTAPSAAQLREAARAALADFVARGVLVADDEPAYLVYRLEMGAVCQTGIVAVVSVADYDAGLIAVHEYTRPDKEQDRTEHIEALQAHSEPVFLMYRDEAPGGNAIAEAIDAAVAGRPLYVVERDGVRHTLWRLTGAEVLRGLEGAFAEVPRLYVADGHHRCAAASRAAAANPGVTGAGWFPAVVFAADQLNILGYNRVVADLAGLDAPRLLDAMREHFTLAPVHTPDLARHQFGVYVHGAWHTATTRPEVLAARAGDATASLDVSILQDLVLAPLLGVADPRTEPRIAFVGGIRGEAELSALVDSGRAAIAFSLHPTSAEEVMDIADGGGVMPPKSTWFEPQLASGLFVHRF